MVFGANGIITVLARQRCHHMSRGETFDLCDVDRAPFASHGQDNVDDSRRGPIL